MEQAPSRAWQHAEACGSPVLLGSLRPFEDEDHYFAPEAPHEACFQLSTASDHGLGWAAGEHWELGFGEPPQAECCIAPGLSAWLAALHENVLDSYGPQLSLHFETPDQVVGVYCEDGEFLREAFFEDFDVEVEKHRLLFDSWFAETL